MKFALLAALGSIHTVPYIESLARAGLKPAAIFVDGSWTPRYREIVRARLESSFVIRDLQDIELLDVPTYFVKNHNEPSLVDFVRLNKIDILVNAGTTRKILPPLLQATKAIVNSHPALLPKFRGSTTLEWSVYLDEPLGATVHFMDEHLDEGPVLFSKKMAVEKFETYESARTRMLSHQASILAEGLVKLNTPSFDIKSLKPQPSTHEVFKTMDETKLAEVKSKMLTGRYESLA